MLIHRKNKKILPKKSVYSIIVSVMLFGFAGTVSAKLTNPLNSKTLAEFIEAIAGIVMQIGGVVAVIFIIWSGFLFVTARGNEEQVKKAKTTFFWTIIGAVILLGAYAIAIAVTSFVSSL